MINRHTDGSDDGHRLTITLLDRNRLGGGVRYTHLAMTGLFHFVVGDDLAGNLGRDRYTFETMTRFLYLVVSDDFARHLTGDRHAFMTMAGFLHFGVGADLNGHLLGLGHALVSGAWNLHADRLAATNSVRAASTRIHHGLPNRFVSGNGLHDRLGNVLVASHVLHDGLVLRNAIPVFVRHLLGRVRGHVAHDSVRFGYACPILTRYFLSLVRRAIPHNSVGLGDAFVIIIRYLLGRVVHLLHLHLHWFCLPNGLVGGHLLLHVTNGNIASRPTSIRWRTAAAATATKRFGLGSKQSDAESCCKSQE